MAQKNGTLKKAEAFELAGQGLWYIFLSRTISLIGRLLALVLFTKNGSAGTTFMLIVLFAAGIVEIYGIYMARPSHPYFKAAFRAEFITLAACIAAICVLELVWPQMWKIGKDILMDFASLWIYWYIAIAARDLLTQKGDAKWARAGDLLWKAYAVQAIVTVISRVALLVPVGMQAAYTVAIAATWVDGLTGVAVGVFSIVFSYKASRSLQT